MHSPKLVGFVLFCFAFVSSLYLLLVQYLIQSFSLLISSALLLLWLLDLLHSTEEVPPIKIFGLNQFLFIVWHCYTLALKEHYKTLVMTLILKIHHSSSIHAHLV